MIDTITKNLGDKADYFLGFKNPKISKDKIHVPSGDCVDRIFGKVGAFFLGALPGALGEGFGAQSLLELMSRGHQPCARAFDLPPRIGDIWSAGQSSRRSLSA